MIYLLIAFAALLSPALLGVVVHSFAPERWRDVR